MQHDPLIFAGVCDWAGIVRGKAFPEAALDVRLAKGVGLTHSNIMMSCFGPIYTTPFGTGGDLLIRPDPDAHAYVSFDNDAAESFYLGDIQNLDGSAWEHCPRGFLRRAIAALAGQGLSLMASFEHEFVYDGVEDRPGATYALDAFRRQGVFGEQLMGAIRAAGFTPDSFLPEYGPCQYEVTIAPEPALRAADAAVIVREMARAVAFRAGHRAIFAPMLEPDGTGNGTHIHMSLWDAEGRPVSHDLGARDGLAPRVAPFFAGILHHLPALAALTAPSAASYFRLTPNRWAPVLIDLRRQDRGAALRIAPIFATSPERAERQFNVEFRVADGASCPHLALGALIFAGVDGLQRGLTLPPPEAEPAVLPRSLGAALDAFAASDAARAWCGPAMHEAYLAFKRAELAAIAGLSDAEICKRYAEVY